MRDRLANFSLASSPTGQTRRNSSLLSWKCSTESSDVHAQRKHANQASDRNDPSFATRPPARCANVQAGVLFYLLNFSSSTSIHPLRYPTSLPDRRMTLLLRCNDSVVAITARRSQWTSLTMMSWLTFHRGSELRKRPNAPSIYATLCFCTANPTRCQEVVELCPQAQRISDVTHAWPDYAI